MTTLDMNDAKHLTGGRLMLAAVAVALATFLLVLDYSIANVSIPYISGTLAVSVDEGVYVITSFAVGNAIVLPLCGWLTRRVGLIRLMTFSILGFTALSWVCGISDSLAMLVMARFLQGAVAGPMIPLSQTLIILIFPPEKQKSALSVWSTVVIVAPIVGPILGGWLSYDYSWPWIFFINIPFGLFSALTIQALLKPYDTVPEKLPVDWIGLALLAISVACLQFLLDKGEQYDWFNSPLIRKCGVISLIGFSFLIPWELFRHKPLLELRLLKIRSFALSVLAISVAYAIYFGAVVLIPLWLQTQMGYTAAWAGVAVASLGILPVLFSSLMGRLTAKVGALIPLAISFILFAGSSFDTARMNTDIDIGHIAFSRFLLGGGLLFLIVPLFQLQMQDLPADKLPAGAGLFHFARAMMGGAGTSIFTTMWTRRSAFHHANLVAELTDRPPFAPFMEHLSLLGVEGPSRWTLLNQIVDGQAAVLGINDCFFFMGWCFLALIPFLLLGRKSSSSPAASPGHLHGTME